MSRTTDERELWEALVDGEVIDWAEWLRRFGAPCICSSTKPKVGKPVMCTSCKRAVPDRRVDNIGHVPERRKEPQLVWLKAKPTATRRTKTRIGTHGGEGFYLERRNAESEMFGGEPAVLVSSREGRWHGWLPEGEVEFVDEHGRSGLRTISPPRWMEEALQEELDSTPKRTARLTERTFGASRLTKPRDSS